MQTVETWIKALTSSEVQSPTLSEAIEDFVDEAASRGLRTKTVRNYSSTLKKLPNAWGDIRVNEVSREMLIAAITSTYSNEESRKDLRRVFRNFFGWCAHPSKQWCKAEVAEKLEWRQLKEDKKPISIYSPEQVRRLFEHLPKKLQPGCACGFFAGIRPHELCSVDKSKMSLLWEDIDFKKQLIEVTERTAKVREARVLHNLPDNLWTFRKKYRKKKGPVVPMNYKNFRTAIKGAMQKTKIKEWPSDVMRKCFATYGYFRGLEWVLSNLGHVSTKMLSKHYKNKKATEAESKAFFSIMPEWEEV